MAKFTPEEIEQRRQRMAEAEGLGGWYLNSLCDGQDSTSGEPLSWYVYQHLDGRRATVSESGSSTDPELQNLLAERRRAEPLPSPEPPWWQTRLSSCKERQYSPLASPDSDVAKRQRSNQSEIKQN